ncbi:hypothetical protein ACX02_23900 [Vibrio parahaemolyticus]|uniref:hypothetical protein n=1 Tax=Vibrio parahaemolyticus TaxID=670 RepID=UPI0006C3CAE1|nr:hypothetical protein [Vibrio parahaemolyticus]ELU9052079.1 hypothetical protein [Vibrio parahaemolyticus]KON49991.1 hypothetical protein ACX02_23900 [Vibrio parahaemolyticus]MCS0032218.1 hypothetical protein [Vibrio parahaemolyticus]
MIEPLEEQFHAEMLKVYESGVRLIPPFRATRFLGLVNRIGGKAAADQLLATPNPSTGFAELFLRGREALKLSVEYVILQERWHPLFSEEQRTIAKKRLESVGVEPPV